MILDWGILYDISYYCNWIPIPNQCSISFNMNSTVLQSTSRSINFFHVCKELTELVMIFGIGIGYNISVFDDVVELLLFPMK
jgi:hypothetical protein